MLGMCARDGGNGDVESRDRLEIAQLYGDALGACTCPHWHTALCMHASSVSACNRAPLSLQPPHRSQSDSSKRQNDELNPKYTTCINFDGVNGSPAKAG